MSTLKRLKERKLVQWIVSYLAGAWLLIGVFSTLREELDWASWLFPVLASVLAVGFVVTLVLAWYHGEQGRQRVTGPELLIIGGILLVAALLTQLAFGSGTGREAAAPASTEPAASPFEDVPGIAVIPFENLSGDLEDASFTAGIGYELARELSRLAGLKVVSQPSAYEDSPLTDRAIGAELGVRYLLRGSVQRAGDDVRLNLRLIETEQGGLVWSDDFTAELAVENLESLFEVQETIVSAVAGELSVELSSEERARLARARTDNPEAYDLYLRASWLDSKQAGGSRDAVERSIDRLERAVELDSTFVDAWAMLSVWHSVFYNYYVDQTPARQQRARETAERAVELDSRNALAQLAMGEYYYRVEKDWEQAREWLERSAGTLHGDVQYHFLRARVERRSGLWEAALASFHRALALRPQAAGFIGQLSWTYLYMRHFDEAERWLAAAESISGEPLLGRRAQLELMRDGALSPSTEQALEPASWAALRLERGNWARVLEDLEDAADPIVNQNTWAPRDFYRGIALRGMVREAGAVEAFTRAIDVLQERTAEASEDPPRVWSILGMAYAALGRADEAREAGKLAVQLRSPEDDALDGIYYLFRLAVTYTWLGDHERAIDALDELLGVPSPYTSVRLENSAWFADLHEDPRFQEVMDEHRGRVF